MLYAIKVGKKWSLVRNKREAIRTAKRNPGAVVWSRDDVPEVNDAWDWLAFIIGARPLSGNAHGIASQEDQSHDL